jgi:hypothetical protein
VTGAVTDPSLIVETLRETATLVRVKIKALGIGRTDKTASADLTEQKRATPGASKVVVSRLPGAEKYHRDIVNAQSKARTELWKLSRQYDEDGWRIMGNDKVEALMAALGDANSEFKAALAAMSENAETIVREAEANKGDFDVTIPTVDELKTAYTLDIDFMPVPDAAEYRNLPSSFEAKIRKKTTRTTAESYARGQAEALGRLLNPLENFVERMLAYDERVEQGFERGTKDRTGEFRNSLIDKVKAIGSELRSFNLDRDPRWEALADQIDTLSGSVTADDLRQDHRLRKRSREQAKAVLDTVKDWGI